MSYDLRYAFSWEPDLDLDAVRLDDSGISLGAAEVISSFDKGGNYGFTVRHPDGDAGFLAFLDGDICVALFSVNPQEGENLDAKVSSIGGELGAGAISFPYTSTNVDGNPIPGVSVWVTSDVEGQHVVAGTLLTDINGAVSFMLDHGTWYLWQFHHSYMFSPNPTVISV